MGPPVINAQRHNSNDDRIPRMGNGAETAKAAEPGKEHNQGIKDDQPQRGFNLLSQADRLYREGLLICTKCK